MSAANRLRSSLLILLPVFLLAVPGCTAAGSAAGPGSVRGAVLAEWAASPIWDDGRAEIAAYEAVAMRYGEPRKFTAYLIVVKEDFSRSELVKADSGHDPADLVPVLKMNQVIHFETGVYDYHQMLSIFFDRSDMIPLKMSLTHFEWCGNTYKELKRHGDKAVLKANTYWDGMAERSFDVPFTGRTLMYDELPVWLRSLPWGPKERNWGVSLIPSQISSRADDPRPRPATLKIRPEVEEVRVGSETLRAYRVDLEWEGGTDTFRFHEDPPHVLISWDRSDGGTYRLLWSRRMPYWKLNAPGDGAHLGVSTPPAIDNG